MRSRALLMLLICAALLSLSACSGGYTCNVTFGSSTCTPSGSGVGTGGSGTGGSGGGGGGGGNTPAAFVYVVDQGTSVSGTANGTVDGYDLSTSAGTFSPITNYTAPQIPVSDFGEGMVVVNKQFVYAVFESTEQLYGWSISSSTGTLTTLSGFPVTLSVSSPIGNLNNYQVISDPAGRYLFLSSGSNNEIFVFSINSTTGALTAVPGSPFFTAINPGSMAVDGLGRFLYACDDNEHEGQSTGSRIMGYSIGSSGALTLIPGSPFATEMWELQGDASGRFLVGTTGNSVAMSGRDDDHLYVFSIDQTTGALTQVSGSPISTTYSPFTIAMQPPSSNGELVYSFSINDAGLGYNSVEGFQLDTTSGALTEIKGSPFSNIFEGQWGQFDQSGSNLLVYSSLLESSGTVTQIGPLSVAGDGTLTAPISPATVVTEGNWVVTDP